MTRPMDDFGYFAMLRTALEMYDLGQRGTGRTTRTIRDARDGDTLIVPTEQIARHCKHVGRASEKELRTLLVASESEILRRTAGLVRAGEAVVFEHTWILEVLREKLGRAERDLQDLHAHLNARSGETPNIPRFRRDR